MRTIDEDEIRRAVNTLHEPDDESGCLFEVRIIDGNWNLSGYFTDADTLIEALKKSDAHANENIYITLNYIDKDCYSRKQHDCFVKNATPTTSDADVFGYQYLMIDLDPERTKGTSSSAVELESARSTARTIFKYMKATGWNDPIIAESGNGVHLLYRVGFEKDGRTDIVKDCLAALDVMFSNDAVKVDTTTFNPARICKLYGTMAQKGADTQIRPHRMSRMVYVPNPIQKNPLAYAEALAAKAPKQEAPSQANNFKPSSFDLREWIARHGIAVKQEMPWNGGTKFVLEHCVFDPSHKSKDAAIVQTADGKICYNCFHASCAGKHWKELRLLYEPDAYSKDAPKPNFMPNFRREREAVATEDPDKPIWLTPMQIRQRVRPKEEYIPTGVKGIDEALIGLKKGFVTLLSGLRACGKSSLISEISLNAAEAGFRTAVFSGELTAENSMRWLYLQAAGKGRVRPSQYANRWYVPDAVQEQIAAWLDGKLWVYDNDFGFEYTAFREDLEKCTTENNIDLIIIDNMMCLDLAALDRDQFVRQSLFVNDLEVFAKQRNVHIILIAHPRKSDGFLRLQDVSGSNDIVNRVDNAIIMHRVNHDFEDGSKREFHWKSDNEIYDASNVLEICKDRDNGTQDKFIPLFYEPETKRLKNDKAEAVQYSWLTDSLDEEPPF
jgi:RecA/RadA recombinase